MEKVRSPFKLCSVCWVFISNVLDSHTKVKNNNNNKPFYLHIKAQLQKNAARGRVSLSVPCAKGSDSPPLVISRRRTCGAHDVNKWGLTPSRKSLS